MLNLILIIMAVLGLIVFIALYFIDAGYGKFRNPKWGVSINNKLGWILMEAPALVPIIALTLPGTVQLLHLKFCKLQLFFVTLYAAHYIYRSFIFPFLLKGKSSMPLSIVAMGATFNFINSFLLCLFILVNPKDAYFHTMDYMEQWYFPAGLVLFLLGAYTHIKSDHTIRSLRKPGDTNHYLPQGGMFEYVTSANYFGELAEWFGFALMINNPAGWMFVWWTAANLVPRSHAIHRKYREEFGNEAVGNRKRIIPFIY